MRLMVSANGSSVSPCSRRTLQHGDSHATDPAGIVLGADFVLVDETGPQHLRAAFHGRWFPGRSGRTRRRPGPSPKASKDWRRFRSSVPLMPPFGTLVRVGDPLDLGGRQLEAGQQSQQMAAWLLVCRPAFPGLLQRLGVLLLLTLPPAFENGQDVFPGVLALVEQRHRELAAGRPCRTRSRGTEARCRCRGTGPGSARLRRERR